MKVGPEPIHNKKLNADNLAEALKFATSEEITKNAEKLGIQMNRECGVKIGVKSFHKQLPIADMVCDFLAGQLAIYYIKNANIKVCEIAASVLLESGKIVKKDLRGYKSKHWDIQAAPDDILESALEGGYSLTVESIKGVTGFVKHTKRGVQKARKAKNKSEATKEFGKGFAKAVGSSMYHPLKGTWEVMGAIGDGFKHAPALVDSNEHFHKRKVVRGIGEGVYEGSKSLAVGFGEGLTDFFLKPIKGAQQGGIAGFGKGFVQGSVSIISKPIAGTMDFIYQAGAGGYATTKTVSDYLKGKTNELKVDDKVRYSVPLEIQERILREYDELLLYASKRNK
ncbi:hypothetical protein HDV01_003873 [Terramyces sp. JEL0728]|nr:hypothetical protein HDV01_003873 [Terramyces sp. JEL0728]